MGKEFTGCSLLSVSYTHLDVYKRQANYDLDVNSLNFKGDDVLHTVGLRFHDLTTPVSYTHLWETAMSTGTKPSNRVPKKLVSTTLA